MKHIWKCIEVGNWYTEYQCTQCKKKVVVNNDGSDEALNTKCLPINMTEDEHIKLVEVGDSFWEKLGLLAAGGAIFGAVEMAGEKIRERAKIPRMPGMGGEAGLAGGMITGWGMGVGARLGEKITGAKGGPAEKTREDWSHNASNNTS